MGENALKKWRRVKGVRMDTKVQRRIHGSPLPRASSLLPCPFCHFSTFLSHDGMTPIFSLSSLPPLSRLMDMEGNLTLERKFGRLGFAMEVE